MACKHCGRRVDLVTSTREDGSIRFKWYTAYGQGLYCGPRNRLWDGHGEIPGHELDLSPEAVTAMLR